MTAGLDGNEGEGSGTDEGLDLIDDEWGIMMAMVEDVGKLKLVEDEIGARRPRGREDRLRSGPISVDEVEESSAVEGREATMALIRLRRWW